MILLLNSLECVPDSRMDSRAFMNIRRGIREASQRPYTRWFGAASICPIAGCSVGRSSGLQLPDGHALGLGNVPGPSYS